MFGWVRRAAVKNRAHALATDLLQLQRDISSLPFEEFTAYVKKRGRGVGFDARDDLYRREMSLWEAGTEEPDFTFTVTYTQDDRRSFIVVGYGDYCGVLITGDQNMSVNVEIIPVGLKQEIGRHARLMRAELLGYPGFYSLDAKLAEYGLNLK